jgi:hypothetical protein
VAGSWAEDPQQVAITVLDGTVGISPSVLTHLTDLRVTTSPAAAVRNKPGDADVLRSQVRCPYPAPTTPPPPPHTSARA